jgi:hypothetical protein
MDADICFAERVFRGSSFGRDAQLGTASGTRSCSCGSACIGGDASRPERVYADSGCIAHAGDGHERRAG